MLVRIRPVEGEADVAIVRGLFVEYAKGLDIDLCFQGFEEELAGLPGKYAPPEGELLLAESEGTPAGCVGLRPLAPGVCEMKRLYVRPAFRGTGLGRRLAIHALQAARAGGYGKMRLDTLTSMASATALYRSLGFRPIEAYYSNPAPGALYFEADLSYGQREYATGTYGWFRARRLAGPAGGSPPLAAQGLAPGLLTAGRRRSA